MVADALPVVFVTAGCAEIFHFSSHRVGECASMPSVGKYTAVSVKCTSESRVLQMIDETNVLEVVVCRVVRAQRS